MIRPIIAALMIFVALGANSGNAGQSAGYKNFASFKNLATGVDFYASSRQNIAPYEKPVAEAIARLQTLFGANLPKGAIFICSTLAQKDSVYEPKILKMGYGWTLTTTTPDVRMQEMQARMKSQMGGAISAEILARFKNRATDMMAQAETQTVSSITQQIAYAVTQTLLVKDLQFRSSRLDDMGKSPLPDWLDIGIASYASGTKLDLAYLQQHMDQTFPIEDILTMARPFVASSSSQSSGGANRGGGSMSRNGESNSGGSGGMQGMPSGMPSGMQGMPSGGFGSRGQSGFPGNGGQRGGMQRNLSKDEQDRMLFDSQASTFFSYVLEKVGIEKIKALIAQAQEGKESREFLSRPDVLGTDFEKTEESWANWVKALKPTTKPETRVRIDPNPN